MSAYDPRGARFASYAEAREAFGRGGDDPRRFLERLLEQIAAREPEVQAFVGLDVEGARRAADASAARWGRGRPLSPVDGMAFGVKDCFDVEGWVTRVNSPVFDDADPANMDAAHVFALRQGGAVLLGKTSTTEWTMAAPAPTANPWDPTRTPGGSSSGSAAAVAAGMLPLATGSQVRGSVVRPASICGTPAFKPTYGALNRHGGVDPTPSLNHLGLIGASLEDVWDAAQQIAQAVGGDPGYAPLQACAQTPPPLRPLRLARQYTAGWSRTDAASQEAFEAWLRGVAGAGVEVLEPAASPELAAYEAETAAIHEWFFDLFWEMRWPLCAWRSARPEALSETMHAHIERAEAVGPERYAAALAKRDALRTLHAALLGRVDAFVTLAHIGPGQVGRPSVGTPWYNDASSAIGAPSLNLPLLAVEGAPLGVQLMGFQGCDERLVGHGRWLLAQLQGRGV